MHLLLLICTLACATARGGAEPPTPRHQLELLLPPADPSGPLQVECALTPRDLDRMRVVFTVTAGETVLVPGEWLYHPTVQPHGDGALALYLGPPPDVEGGSFYSHNGYFDLDRYTLLHAGETVTLQTWLLLDSQSTTPRYLMGYEPAEVARPLRCALAYWPITDETALSPMTMNWRGRQYATSASVVVRGVEAPRDP